MSKVWLIGEHNPWSAEPKFALYPRPEHATGGRLCKALGLRNLEYLRTFERRDLLLTARWCVPAAREAAGKVLLETETDDAMILLGGKVAAAFGYAFEPLKIHRTVRISFLVTPHPSGRSPVWKLPGMADRVRDAVMALVAERAA